MNYQNNFGNQMNLTPEQQQQQQYWAQQSYQQPNWQFNAGQQYVTPAFYPPQVHNFNIHSVPPPPPEEPASHYKAPEPVPTNSNQRSSGPSTNQRGNFHNSVNRGKNKPQQNWTKGNQRGGGANKGGNSRGGGQNQFSSDRSHFSADRGGSQNQFSSDNQANNQFRDARDMEQNQGSFGQNKNRKNLNQNQNWNQQGNQSNAKRPKIDPTPAIATATNFSNQPPSKFSSVQQSPAPKNDQPTSTTPTTSGSQEELEFDEQFRKWEEEFDKWKKANVNHPDKDAYRQYEQQFESVRVKLLQRRNEMQKKKQDLKPPKTVEQLQFETQWIAGGSKNENKPKSPEVPQPTTSNFSMPQQSFDNSEFQDNSFDDIQQFGLPEENRFCPMDFAISNSARMIPGFDFVSEEPVPVEEPVNNDDAKHVVDLEIDEKLVDARESPPPLPKFVNNKKRRPVKDISEILDDPGRSQRREKILILIRGPPGSGKSYLANLIQEKEKKMGNNRVTTLSLHKFHDGPWDAEKLRKCQEDQLNELKKLVLDDFFNLIVVEVEGGKLTYFNKFVHCAITRGNFKTYYIEIHQPYDICIKYNVNRRGFAEILDTIEDLDRYPPSLNHELLDPTSLLKPPAPVEEKGNINEFATNLAQLLQNKNVMELLQSQLNPQKQETQLNPLMTPQAGPMMQPQVRPLMTSPVRPLMTETMLRPPHFQQNQFQQQQNNFGNPPPNFDGSRNFSSNFSLNSKPFGKENFDYNFGQQPPQEPTYDDCPTFTPAKIIDYKHAHMPTLYEQLMEFKVFRVIDYKHKTSPNLRDFVKDIDTDKIIEKRKSVALRKKILEYLKSAERPEDTVSNPKYPRNWEVIPRAHRPPLKNKRKKKKTAKIMRVLARIDDSWMTKGYSETARKMDLEEISSDESISSSFADEASQKKDDLFDDDCFEEPTVMLTPPGTTPHFNRFNHHRVMDIKRLLWNPERQSRPSRVSIILRGPPGSGKSHLAQLIKKKETEMGNSGLRIVSINDYFEALDEKDYDNELQMVETFLNQMVKLVDNRMKEAVCNFIIIDAENIDLKFYHQFYQAGASKGFTTYTIELYQTLEVCLSQNIHGKPEAEIKVDIEKLEKNRIPDNHVLLIATELYVENNCLVNPALKKVEDKNEISKSSNSHEDVPSTSQLFKSLDSKIPKFNWHLRSIINIEDILEEPGRSTRSSRIMIILRGPPGAGKTYLAGLIRAKEVEKGNAEGVINLSIDDYFIDPFTLSYKYDRNKVAKNIEGMLQTLTSIIGNQSYNFIIIDAENGDLKVYEKFHKAGVAGGFKCYTIELLQDTEICATNNNHNRPIEDIKNVLEEMKSSLIPNYHVLLNPLYLYTGESLKTSTKHDESRPLKSALKACDSLISPILGLNRLSKTTQPKNNVHEEFRSRLKQPIMVKGEFTMKNFNPPKLPEFNWHNREIVDIREIIEEPGRSSRPDKIIIVLRGAPGAGKTYLANLIERKEVEKGNRAHFKLLTMDEYFVSEQTREVVDENGAKRSETYKQYDYEPLKLNSYMESLVEQLKNVTQKNEFKFIVVDGDFCDLKFYEKVFEIAKSKNYTGYTIEVNQDNDICMKYNDHKRDDEVAAKNELMGSMPTPEEHILLDPEYLYGEYNYNLASDEEKMEVSDIASDDDFESDEGIEASFGPLKKTQISSKWDDDGDAPDLLIERLDGTRNKTFENLTMAAYLKTDDEWTMRPSTSGKKRVRWADIEEKKEQEKMREIGFIVGQTDWKRMTDTTDGKSALEKTKYIEPRKK